MINDVTVQECDNLLPFGSQSYGFPTATGSAISRPDAPPRFAIWLMPFQVSPHRDEGYYIADYYGVDPRYGTIGDFVDYVRR